jgi:molybdopterin converting factor subunit 1
VRVTIRLFARLREIAGAGALARDVPEGATVAAVWDALAAEFPALAPYGAISSCAVNEDYAGRGIEVHEGDEIAFLPPVSGGMRAPGATSQGSE